MSIELGDRVRDRISGIKGIVVGRTDWIYGCRRLTIQPEESKDGKPADSFCIDEPQAEVIRTGVILGIPAGDVAAKPERRSRGVRPDAGRRSDPRR